MSFTYTLSEVISPPIVTLPLRLAPTDAMIRSRALNVPCTVVSSYLVALFDATQFHRAEPATYAAVPCQVPALTVPTDVILV